MRWVPGKCHTYLKVATPQDEADKYIAMAKTIASRVDHVSASVYTQTTDVELECDGFLNYDRTSKFDANQTKSIAAANQVPQAIGRLAWGRAFLLVLRVL